MSITLNLGRLAKTMSPQDKIKLLLADTEKRAETSGKEYILTPQEQNAIIEDARRNNEMGILRKAHSYYQISHYILMDLDVSYLRYLVHYSIVDRQVIGCHIKAEADEIIGQILYDQVKQNSDSDKNKDNALEALYTKYIPKGSILHSFEYFPPADEKGLQELNTYIQKGFMDMFRFARSMQKKLYELTYVIEQIGFNFLSDTTKETIERYKKQIEEFTNLDSLLRPLRMFRDFDFENLKNNQMTEPEFFDTIKNLKTKLELSEEEKAESRKTVDKYAQEDL